MKHVHDANGKEVISDEQPYAMLGSGQVTASLWKHGNEQGGWEYRYNIFRMARANGIVSHWLHPRDVESLAKLTRLLAFVIADDGCLETSVRDDLYCLAACLDDVLGDPIANANRRLAKEDVRAIEAVVDYLWESQEKDFEANPSDEHIFVHLQSLKCLLRAYQPQGNGVSQ